MSGTVRVAACEEGRLAVGEIAGFTLSGWPVMLVRTADGFHALLDRCSHVGAPLSDGRLRRGAVQCARHGALFDVATGGCRPPSYPAIPVFPVAVEAGQVMVELPDRPPTVDELPVPFA